MFKEKRWKIFRKPGQLLDQLKKLQQAQLLRAGSILLDNTRFLIISFLTNSCDEGYEADTAVATLFAERISAQMCLFFKLLVLQVL